MTLAFLFKTTFRRNVQNHTQIFKLFKTLFQEYLHESSMPLFLMDLKELLAVSCYVKMEGHLKLYNHLLNIVYFQNALIKN